MKFKLVILFLFIGLISCNSNESKIRESHKEYSSVTKIDSIFNQLEIETVNKDNEKFKNDTLVWYNIYDFETKKLKEKLEIHYQKNKSKLPYSNQFINFDDKGNIIEELSHYVELHIKDSLKYGKAWYNVDYHGRKRKDRSLIAVCVENDYGLKKSKDTFFGVKDNNRDKVGIISGKKGYNTIKGYFIQKYSNRTKINDSIGTLHVTVNDIYFNKKVYVKEKSK